MREIRTSGSEGGGAGNLTGPPYPYREPGPSARNARNPILPCRRNGRHLFGSVYPDGAARVKRRPWESIFLGFPDAERSLGLSSKAGESSDRCREAQFS